MKKLGIFLLGVLLLQVFAINLISATLDLQVEKSEISPIAILDINKPAIFELTIHNNGSSDDFQIYTLVGRVEIMPNESFRIEQGDTKTLLLEIFPKHTTGTFSFEYKIRNSEGDIDTESLAINIVSLENAFDFYAEPINPDSEVATLYLKNKAGYKIENINLDLSCIFFESKQTITLNSFESKKIEVPIDKEASKSVLAGPYIINAKLVIQEKETELSTVIKFTEKEGIDTQESIEGVLVRRHEISKSNLGNVKTDVELIFVKNFLEGWFTGFNLPETNKDTVGFKTYYIFDDTLNPGESLKVVAKTNWWLLILIIIAVIVLFYLSIKYSNTKMTLTKKTTFVKTKGGEFALKISIVLKARDFIENIKVTDKIPGMVKLYERYGTISPDKVDHQNKKLEWNMDNLNKGEERIFSYIIYSKIGVLGKFELPQAYAIYEFKGKPKEIFSNKTFFINEPGNKKPKFEEK